MISLREVQRRAFEMRIPEQAVERDYVLTEFSPPQATPLSPKARRASGSGQGGLLARLQPKDLI